MMRALFVLAALFAGCTSDTRRGHGDLPTVNGLDTDRYLGTWYEIGSYANRFQKGCVATSAIYTRKENGRIGVANTCRRERLDGEVRSIQGEAWSASGDSARLKVRFFWPFSGDYWVIGLDPQYRWALVGEPRRKYLWILSREPSMDETTYARILELAQQRGYDPARVQRTPQPTSAH